MWEGRGCAYKRARWNNRNVLCLDYINVIILVVRLYYSFSRCYHWGKLNREYYVILGFPSGSLVKNTHARQKLQETQFISGFGGSPGGGHGNPLQYSCLENPMDKKSLAGYSPKGHRELEMIEASQHACMGSLCITFYNCKWIYNYLKMEAQW